MPCSCCTCSGGDNGDSDGGGDNGDSDDGGGDNGDSDYDGGGDDVTTDSINSTHPILPPSL